jgi:hypothetical protein
VNNKLPISAAGEALFKACHDGILLCKLINRSIPDTIDERVLNKTNLSHFKVVANQNLCINSAKAVGCNVVNIGYTDLVEGSPHLLMRLISQIKFVAKLEVPEESREEKSFRNWMNSLGVDPNVHSFYDDLRDGLVLIQLFDKIFPGLVDQKKVNYPPFEAQGGEQKKIENCNYALQLAKEVKFSVVETDKNKDLTLSIVWQLMRAYNLQQLSGANKNISDNDILNWASQKLQGAKGYQLEQGFKDPKLKSAIPIFDLMDAIRSGFVDYEIVYQDADEVSYLENAQAALSLIRKLGAAVFAFPEDIVELKEKMLLTIFASLMAVDVGVSKS